MYKIRPLEEQFKTDTLSKIHKIQSELEKYPIQDGAGTFFAKELIYSLEAGLLLASIHIAASLLEIFIRDVVIYLGKHDASSSQNKNISLDNQEILIEDNKKPQWDFGKLLKELRRRDFINKEEVLELREFYDKIRTPIFHGLSRRFLRGSRHESPGSIKEEKFPIGFFQSRGMRKSLLEEKMEDDALGIVEHVAEFIAKHSEKIQANPA